jgi:hypothetical protein
LDFKEALNFIQCNFGMSKQKMLNYFFTEKFDFESGNPIFTSEIESIMLANKGVKSRQNKKEVKNNLLSNMTPLKGQIKNKNIQVILCNFTA